MVDVERFCTALAIRNMSPEVHHEWAKYIKGHDGIPPINVFKDFLTEQMRTLRPGAENHLKKPTAQNYSSYRPKPTKASIHLMEVLLQDLVQYEVSPYIHYIFALFLNPLQHNRSWGW